MSHDCSKLDCQCGCGQTKFEIKSKPIARIICHCKICQEFNDAPYADISIFRSKDVQLETSSKVDFKAYTSPPLIQRGKCTACEQPAIEFLNLPLTPSFTVIPSVHIPEGEFLPEPSLHAFYHRRVSDINDNLPKYSGYLKSQGAVGYHIMSSMLRSFLFKT